MEKIGQLDRNAAKFTPESVFSSPLAIVEETMLTRGEKLATLQRWQDNVLREFDATSEGMPSNGTAPKSTEILRQIEDARQLLEVEGGSAR